jgi:hypothetical protein
VLFIEQGNNMGQVIWIMAGAAAVGAVIGLTSLSHQERVSATTKVVPTEEAGVAEARSDVGEPEVVELGASGSALAAAAFGLSALQPETYDGELVLDIIDASHLDEVAKEELAADLEAAEKGRADLDDVLEDVRIALAVE